MGASAEEDEPEQGQGGEGHRQAVPGHGEGFSGDEEVGWQLPDGYKALRWALSLCRHGRILTGANI